MTHDLTTQITLDNLNKLYTSNNLELTLYITVKMVKYEYKTLLEHFSDGTFEYFNYKFLDTNGIKFLEIFISNSIAQLLIDLVNKNVTCIGKLKRLETVFYLTTWFCAMIGINDIDMTDAAHSACTDDLPDIYNHNKYKNDYSLTLYRMLATKLPLKSISIYTKFFKNVQDPLLTQDDIAHLESLRLITIEQFKKMTHPLVLDEIKDLPNDLTLFIFFDRFLEKKNCQYYSMLMKRIEKVLIKIEPYRSLLNKTRRYIVHVTDSIYYNNLDPESPKSNYSSKRRTKNKSQKSGSKQHTNKSRTKNKFRKSGSKRRTKNKSCKSGRK